MVVAILFLACLLWLAYRVRKRHRLADTMAHNPYWCKRFY